MTKSKNVDAGEKAGKSKSASKAGKSKAGKSARLVEADNFDGEAED